MVVKLSNVFAARAQTVAGQSKKILWKKGAFEKKEPLEKRLVNLWKKDFKTQKFFGKKKLAAFGKKNMI